MNYVEWGRETYRPDEPDAKRAERAPTSYASTPTSAEFAALRAEVRRLQSDVAALKSKLATQRPVALTSSKSGWNPWDE